MSGSQIVPGEIWGLDVVPETISAAAAGYRTTSTAIGTAADGVLADWSGLAGVYVAPESGQLLTAMDPVRTDTEALCGDLDTVATLLDDLASAVAGPVARLKELQVEAQEFVDSVRGGVHVDYYDPDNTLYQANAMSGAPVLLPEGQGDQVIPWDQHTPSVDRNNELLQQVNAEVAKLDAARADFVDGVNALRTDICVVPSTAFTAEQLDASTDAPWGVQGKGDRSCSESVGDGLVLFGQGLVEGAVSLAGFDAANGWEHDWDFAGQAWTGMLTGLGALAITVVVPVAPALAQLPDSAVPPALRGLRDTYRDTMQGMVEGFVGSPEQWEEDPVAAGTYAVANIGSMFIPVGGGVVAGTKVVTGAARAATLTTRMTEIAGDGARFSLGLERAGSLVDRFGADGSGLRGLASADDLGAALKALDDLPDVEFEGLTRALDEGRGVDWSDVSGLDRVDADVDAPAPARVGGEGDAPGGPHRGEGTTSTAPFGRGAPLPDVRSVTMEGSLFEPSADVARTVEPGSTTTRSVEDHLPVSGDRPVIVVEAPGPRTPFARGQQLEPDAVYEVEGRGRFHTDATGRITHVETQYGSRGALNADLMRPVPDTTYVVDGRHVYVTDSQGRTILAQADQLELRDVDRSPSVQQTVGHRGGEGYEGGHLISNATGGGAEYVNNVPMLESVNRGAGDSFGNLESALRRMVDPSRTDPPASVFLQVRPQFRDGDVPDLLAVRYTINGGEPVDVIFRNR